MKKIFTLFAVAAMTLTAAAQDNVFKASGEAVEAGTVLVDNEDLTVKAPYAANGGVDAQTICGIEFAGYFQLRVASDPTAEAPDGGDNGGSTSLVVTVKKPIDFAIFTRRQQGSDGFNAGDNKGILAMNQADMEKVSSVITLDENADPNESYAFVKDTFTFPAGTYTLYRRGSTMRVFGFEWTVDTQNSIADIVADEDAPVEYFNLQGIRVANPENGLYIRRQGNKVEKIYVK